MNENPIKIEISGGKLSYSDEVTINQAAQVIAFLNPGDGEPVKLGTPLHEPDEAAPVNNDKNVSSPREALEVSGAQKNPEKIVALAAYVLRDGGETFKLDDVKAQFRRARETPPANFSRDLGIAIASGWVIEDSDGEYVLHNKFDSIFNGGFTFPSATSHGRARATKSPGSKAKARKPESLNDIDAFHTTLDGFASYSKLKSEKDRLLWVVAYMADKHGRSGATNQEVVYITGELGAVISSGNLTGAFNTAKTPGYAFRSHSDKTIHITEDGRAYLAKVGSKDEASA
jgi:hypothetical protein